MEESPWIWIVFVLWPLFGVGALVLPRSREPWPCTMAAEIDTSYLSLTALITVSFPAPHLVCFFFVAGMSFEVLFCIALRWGFTVT